MEQQQHRITTAEDNCSSIWYLSPAIYHLGFPEMDMVYLLGNPQQRSFLSTCPIPNFLHLHPLIRSFLWKHHLLWIIWWPVILMLKEVVKVSFHPSSLSIQWYQTLPFLLLNPMSSAHIFFFKAPVCSAVPCRGCFFLPRSESLLYHFSWWRDQGLWWWNDVLVLFYSLFIATNT